MSMILTYPLDALDHRFAAIVIEAETDRETYVPPPVARYEHADFCRCETCRLDRRSAKATGRGLHP